MSVCLSCFFCPFLFFIDYIVQVRAGKKRGVHGAAKEEESLLTTPAHD